MEQIDSMSWRRFTTLFRNLSPYGATASSVQEMRKNPPQDEEISEEDGKAQAAAFFASVMSTGR